MSAPEEQTVYALAPLSVATVSFLIGESVNTPASSTDLLERGGRQWADGL